MSKKKKQGIGCSKNKEQSEDEKIIESKEDIETEVHFEVKPFTEEELSEDDKYVYKLDKLLNDDKIQRIGLIGPYGSGKSSIINTLILKNDETRKYLTLSAINLGDACNVDYLQDTENDETTEAVGINDLKYKLPSIRKILVNQIISQIEDEVKEEKDFQVLVKQIYHYTSPKNVSEEEKKVYSWGIVLLILDIVMISLFDFQTMQKRFLTFKLTLLNIISIIGIIVFIVMLIYSLRIVYYLTNKFIDFMSCISIKSLKIAGNSLEKSNSTEMSFLDKDVETIIKLLKIYKKFIVNKDLIVVIEDIDRYESTELFLELYHISSICTNIKFIFPMNAELFSPIELSKYFNAIVDIIPFNDKVTLGKEIIKSLDKVSSKGAFKVNPSIVFKTLPFVSDLREAIRIENKYVTNIENHATVEANVLNEDSIGLRTKIYAYSFLETRFPKEVNNYSSDENLLKEIINEIEEKWEVWSASNIKKINYSRERYNEEKNESMKKYKELNEGKIRYNGDEEFIEDYYDKIINRYGGVLTYTKYLENPGMHINAYLSDEEYKEFEEKERNEIEKQKKI